jgi:hypothetical protein
VGHNALVKEKLWALLTQEKVSVSDMNHECASKEKDFIQEGM